MKTLKLFVPALFAVVLGFNASAQTHDHMNMNMPSTKTETFKVWGNCDMCKARIEKTVKAEGATSAAWDAKTKMLAVTFDPSKTSMDAFGKKLASVGHDTEKYKADDKVYNALPGCCKYERNK
ncbi:MAG: heavy-metal-associated domain-containing protein [Bacteroidetes bacterium]|nr:heavy-metal-associated domain-containing protein [Bacteroidota bacterium]